MEFSRQNSGVSCYSFLQEIFPIQGVNLVLLYYRQILYHLSHQESLYSIYLSGYCLLIPTRLTPTIAEIFLLFIAVALAP